MTEIKLSLPEDTLRVVFDARHIYFARSIVVDDAAKTLAFRTSHVDFKAAVNAHYQSMFKPVEVNQPNISISLAYTLWTFTRCSVYGQQIRASGLALYTFMYEDLRVTEITG